MWIKVSRFILRNKISLLAILLAITVFFAFQASKLEMSYEYAPLLPAKDRAFKENLDFVKVFGEEGNLILIGIQDSAFFNIDHFGRWDKFCEKLNEVVGVENLLSVANSYDLVRNSDQRKFTVKPIFPDTLQNQAELDTLARRFRQLEFYNNLLYNDSTNTFLLAITVNKDKMRSREREGLVRNIKFIGDEFANENNVKLHYSGLPYIRVITSVKIKNELYLFSILALVVCIIALYIFFRSFKSVIIPVIIVLTGVVWAMGMLGLFGFKITILTGMIPPLLIVIGIPNSIYMLNKYHYEYLQHGNKVKALQRVIIKIGTATFMTNLTTAAGFATFIITKSDILKEFGIVASLNIMGLFLLSLLLNPIIFSFVKPPSTRNIKHLEGRFVTRIIDRIILITKKHRKPVYWVSAIVVLLSFYGISLIKSSGYMVDDIPERDPIYQDLKFFETNFHGLMPMEIMVDTKKPNGVIQLSTFHKIDELEQKLSKYPDLSPPLSLLNLFKFAKQAFYNGDPAYYSLPNNYEKNFILAYASQGGQNISLLHSFLDSAKQVTRISIRAKDVGTKQMAELYKSVKNDIDSVFAADNYKVTITGSSVTFFRGTQYLQKNLFSSLGLAIFLIAVFMAIMFFSPRMVLMSLIPNLIPLVFTAAVMGFAGIPIKASTILIFSVAFGISVDSTIHFLTKYRLELQATGSNIRRSVVFALRETGVSMIYTVVVLFFGFGIFSLSSFGGTQAMGILVSLTLLVAVTSNLVLLPSLLTGLDRFSTTETFEKPPLHLEDGEEEMKKFEELSSDNDDIK